MIAMDNEAVLTAMGRDTRMFDAVSRIAGVGGWQVDPSHGQMHWSREFYRICEIPQEVASTLESFLDLFTEDDRRDIEFMLQEAIVDGTVFEFERPFVTARGRLRWARVIGEVDHTDGIVSQVFGTVQDITRQKLRENEIEYVATHDTLTGLPNRQLFASRLDEICERGIHPCVMLIDVDHFKSINDTFGHDAGDVVLVEVAHRFKKCLRDTDTVARLGGDEFAVILPGALDAAEAEEVALRLQASLGRSIVHDADCSRVSASIGIALLREDGTDGKDLLKKADIALYEAKADGRACHAFFDPNLEYLISARHHVQKAIQDAISAEQIVPFYQPIVAAGDHSVSRFEALVRWVEPSGRVLTPAFFLPAFDDPRTVCLIGESMLAAVLGQITAWNVDGLAFGAVSINVSPDQLRKGEFAERLVAGIAAAGIDPGQVCVEVTESIFLSRDTQRICAALDMIREAGVCIEFDDFGTGYASLTHLKEFAVDRIKIDKSFVAPLPDDRPSFGIVKAVTELCANLGKEVICEGVETDDQARLLAGLGCDYLQGFLFSPAVCASDVPELITRLSPPLEMAVQTA